MQPMLQRQSERIGVAITALAAAVSIIVAVAIPAGFFVKERQAEMERLETEANFIANGVLPFIYSTGSLWRFQELRVLEIMSRAMAANDGREERAREYFAVLDSDGDVVASVGNKPDSLALQITLPLEANGQKMGQIVVSESLRYLAYNTAWVTLLSVFMAALVFVSARALPMRILDHTFERLSQTQKELRDRVSELEAAHQELERRGRALQETASNLNAALAEAAAASQAKSSFLANMSHELRTPLNAVIGFAQLLENQIFGSLGSTKYTEYARLIRESGSHLLAIINDILDLSKVEAGKIEMHESTVDAAALVREVASPFRLEAGIKRLGFAVEERRGLPALWADERMLRQILINLLSNAFKFTPAGGRVAIAAGCDRNGAPFFEVRDTGIGIAPEDMETALTPFGQVANVFTRQYQGTGLGLPLAKSFAELHGGLLTIDSTPGEGTTIRIVLPPERACRVAIA